MGHGQAERSCTLMSTGQEMRIPCLDAETLRMDEQGYIRELGKRPVNLSQIEAQYMGLIKVSARMASRVVAAYQSLDPADPYDGKET